MSFVPFPSIDSFRHAVKAVRTWCDHHNQPYPIVNYRGLVKLHGTNAGIRIQDGRLIAQSRSRDLTVQDDNMGFARWVADNEDELMRLLCIEDDIGEGCVVFGEWCGRGIQKNVALADLPFKAFVSFGAYRPSDHDVENPDSRGISPSRMHAFIAPADTTWDVMIRVSIPTEYRIKVDFNKPDEVVAELERLTEEVENLCPFGDFFGVRGIGEGLVWTPELDSKALIAPTGKLEATRMWFKTKGEKHGNKATNNNVKVRVSAEKVADLAALISEICPEWRLAQGISELQAGDKQLSRANTQDFIRWVCADVNKEQGDMIVASGFDNSVVMAEVVNLSRRYFLSKF